MNLRAINIAILLLLVTGCGLNPNHAPKLPDVESGPTVKPSLSSVSHVALTVFTELSHIERAIKPVFKTNTPAPPTTTTRGPGSCQTTKHTAIDTFETNWKCGLDDTSSGKKEIEGVEKVHFDSSQQTLSYEAKFQTRNFVDREPRAKAHTLAQSRQLTITFEKGATATSGIARLKLISTASVKFGDATIKIGSNWKIIVIGKMVYNDNRWTLEPGTSISFSGVLFGLDGERATLHASGDHNFVSKSSIDLGTFDAGSCTKPAGLWEASAASLGQKIETTLETSELGGIVSGGSNLNWPNDLCESP